MSLPRDIALRTYRTDTYSSISPTLAHLSTAGKSALVTGAGAGGIGAAITASLARSGISTLGLLGRNESRLRQTEQTVQAISPTTTVHIYIADLTDRPAVQTAVSTFAAAIPGGTIDILIANAGYMSELSSVAAAEPVEWWKSFEINVLGNMHLVQAFLPFATPATAKEDDKGAAIVHISSSVVHGPYLPQYSAYRAAKAGATKMFEYIAAENPQHFVLQVHPGFILTSAMAADRFLDKAKKYGLQGDSGKSSNPGFLPFSAHA
jgi:NAD(P)-dependent dehydrogenase (short-subunit alcohol dehydrogenase family)